MNDHENPPQRVHSQRDKALFALRIGIVHCQRVRVSERLLCIRKAHAVLA